MSVGRQHLSILLGVVAVLIIGLSCDGDDEGVSWCDQPKRCEVDDCSCERDEDCTVEVCAFIPEEWPSPEDGECDWCQTCSNGYPIPVDVWADLRESWLDSCGGDNRLCIGGCSGDYDCCANCLYAPRCEDGQCVGVVAEESPTGWCE